MIALMATAPASKPSKAGYHHGDLRQRLVDAATEILRETQRWDFSLREVARRAGVSHNAPYGHFADKSALLAAVGVAGYEALRQRMLMASADALDADAALTATGMAYIGFGLENPAHYRLMFGQELQSDGALPSNLLAAAEAARAVLRDIVHRGAEDASLDVDPADALGLTAAVLACWALVHGFTLLAIDGLAQMESTVDVAQLAILTATRFRRGLVGTRPPRHR
ncbi:TetR family transcriptional regulator [Sphingomonas sp. PP-F2F-G114-C0414]|uniref:TetR/AcrR family transcriptional regulator n=1 Tax=Sphingomonas sp. PP-F2F-G114-C0414 TaxID=2135662 RepID=UPI000EF8B842|nr:TetR/AcrR family transcriptional regulator [Sphingomonas sp. PP-F2F-G114-C0414]RMB36653.1 TetR family transcriptional regulator [Sphingomonas sp. PP-F2F-G114-C0414]